MTEGLADELRPFGINVCVVEPGYTRTGFLVTGTAGQADHRIRTAKTLPVYHNTTAAEIRGAMDAYDGNQPGDVDKSAKVIVDVLTQDGVAKGKQVPVRLVLGSDCLDTVRRKCEETLKLLKEWEDVSKSTMAD
jgi:NAD(P)-dependent dehydrogenase (short-subunit alcohol dehydrogenase family)